MDFGYLLNLFPLDHAEKILSSCKKEMKKSWRIYVLKDPNIGGRQGDENGSGDENRFE
jgi:hypothetical protein